MRATAFLCGNNPAVRSMLQMEGALEVVHGMTSKGKGVLVKDVAVELAGAAFVVTALVSPQSDLCSGGEIGMDVLRHCDIVWAWDALWLGCHPPPAPAR